MKIGYVSDIHKEFNKRSFNIFDEYDKSNDVLVIAGDLNVGARAVIADLKTIREITQTRIIYVAGNHEFYHSTYGFEKSIFDKAKDILRENDIYILDNENVILDGINFIGVIGWPDHSFREVSRRTFPDYNDFNLIKDFTNDHKIWGDECVSFIESSLSRDIPNVIVMHWLPTVDCISPRYMGDRYNPCFANDWQTKIKYWTKKRKCDILAIIHGHSHDPIRIKSDKIQIVRNPIGYPHEGIRFNINEFITV